MKKLFLLPLILLLTLVPLATGLEVIVSRVDYGSSSAIVQLGAAHPSSTSTRSAYGNSFRSYFDNANLTTLTLYAFQSSATGGCTAYLIGETGTFGSSSLPTGSVLATSNEVTITAGTSTPINFTFASGYMLDSAVDYCWYVAGTSGDVATETFDHDNTAPLNSDPAVGNEFYYASSTWTAVSTADMCYVMYASDGSAVSFNLGGDVTINQITETTNVTAEVTAEINATASFNNTSVIASGGVTVENLSAEFNNTIVQAGAVSAGDVTANGEVTVTGGVSVNGTFDNATLTYVTSTAVSGDANVYFLIAFIALAVLLTFYNKVPLMNFLVGIVGISFITLSFQNTDLPFWPYSSVLLALTSLICMISGGFKLRSG